MVNQKTFESLYHYYFDEEIKTDDQSEEELYHHGVLGQSWGKKHGPPYPLDGIDKKIARAEARKKKERERKLKKMQRAAKKARREKKREEKREADILKKKQKLMKSGDMDQIRKNAKLFTNEELAYIMDREQLKKGLKGKDERSTDEKMELFMKRMGQIASIASSAQQVLGAAKTGMDVMQSYKATKVKELEADEKRMKALREEFEMRFQGDERSSSEAKRFLDDRINDRNYKPSKEKAPKESKAEKEERKTDEAIRVAQAREGRETLKEYEKSKKRSKKEERQALKDEKKAEKEALKGGHKGMTWIKDGGNTFSTSDPNVRQFDVGSKFVQSKPVMESVYTPSSPSTSSGRKFMYNTSSRTKWGSIPASSAKKGNDDLVQRFKDAYFKDDTKRAWADMNNGWEPKMKAKYDTGKEWTTGFLGSDWKGPTYTTSKSYSGVNDLLSSKSVNDEWLKAYYALDKSDLSDRVRTKLYRKSRGYD
jgi:hypothetical protein